MSGSWPSVNYEDWRATCDTLHAHSQLLGKLAVALAPSEPQFQHAALRLTARGLETPLLPAPNGSGGFVVTLDLRRHEVVVEHTDGRDRRAPLTPNRSVAEVAAAVLEAVLHLAGPVQIDLTPQEVDWSVPLDQDEEHSSYDTDHVTAYFAAATQVALVLAAFRAPYRGRSSRVNMWWGSFDLAVNLFSGRAAKPPAEDYIMRNAMDSEEVAVGWWPGDPRYPKAAFYAYMHPARDTFSDLPVAPARWDAKLGEYVLDWDEVRSSPDPRAVALGFAHGVFRHACTLCAWDPTLASSAEGSPPPLA
ncbi:MAG TPA: DUF5996 family protein [Solirubrobacteraceae bacterium]|nr:DUF5996 family protein [Solirubrobacteraceae bacterium]